MVFTGRKIIIQQNEDLSVLKHEQLRNEIVKNHGEIVAWDARADVDVSPKLIVVSTTIEYDRSQEMQKFMVPTVTPDWIFACIAEQKLVPMRPYSPDPRNFLKDVIACLSQLSEGDQDCFKAGLRACGGDYCDVVTRYTSHVVSTNIDTPECQLVLQSRKSNPHIGIKLVHPEWLDTCMKLQCKVDDNFYLLDKPIPDTQEGQDLSGTFPVRDSPRLAIQQSVRDTLGTEVLESKRFFLGADLGLSDIVMKTVKYLIETNGGKIVGNLDNADVYLGKWREGDEYLRASQLKLIVGNITWLYWVTIHQSFEKPTRLLHYPEVKEGLQSFKNLKICVTNYTGDARAYLQSLIESIGATYSGKLVEKNTTHLITAYEAGQKYEAAKRWNIPVVNHLWLEDSFAYWHKQDEQSRLYTYFPSKLSMSTLIGNRNLVPNVLQKFKNPLPFVDTRDHPKRQAKRKAGDWLHDAMIIEGEFQKKAKRGKIPVSEEEEDEDKRRSKPQSRDHGASASASRGEEYMDIDKSHELTLDKPNIEPLSELNSADQTRVPEPVPVPENEDVPEHVPTPQEQRSKPQPKSRSKPAQNLRIMFSGVDTPPTNKKCHAAGMSVVKALPVNVLVAPKFLKTSKFLQAMAHTNDFVTPLWVDASIEMNKPAPIDEFRINDEALKTALENRSKLTGPLFHNMKFFLDHKLRDKLATVKELAKSHGGSVVAKAQQSTIIIGDGPGDLPFDDFIHAIQTMDASKLGGAPPNGMQPTTGKLPNVEEPKMPDESANVEESANIEGPKKSEVPAKSEEHKPEESTKPEESKPEDSAKPEEPQPTEQVSVNSASSSENKPGPSSANPSNPPVPNPLERTAQDTEHPGVLEETQPQIQEETQPQVHASQPVESINTFTELPVRPSTTGNPEI